MDINSECGWLSRSLCVRCHVYDYLAHIKFVWSVERSISYKILSVVQTYSRQTGGNGPMILQKVALEPGKRYLQITARVRALVNWLRGSSLKLTAMVLVNFTCTAHFKTSIYIRREEWQKTSQVSNNRNVCARSSQLVPSCMIIKNQEPRFIDTVE